MKAPSQNQIDRYLKKVARNSTGKLGANKLLKFKIPNDPRVIINKTHQTCTLFYTANPYEVDLDKITGLGDLLKWTYHLSKKPWLDKQNLKEIIRRIALEKGFDLNLGRTEAAAQRERDNASRN